MSLRTLITGTLIGLSIGCTDTDVLEHCGVPYHADFTEQHLALEAGAEKALHITDKTSGKEICDLVEDMTKIGREVFTAHTWIKKKEKQNDFFIGPSDRVLSDWYIPRIGFEGLQGLQCYEQKHTLKAETVAEMRERTPDFPEVITMYGCRFATSRHRGVCLAPEVDFDVVAVSPAFYYVDMTYEKEYSEARVRAIMGYPPVDNFVKDVPLGDINISYWVTLGSPFSKDQDFIRNCQEKKNEEWFTYAKELAAFAKEIVERKE